MVVEGSRPDRLETGLEQWGPIPQHCLSICEVAGPCQVVSGKCVVNDCIYEKFQGELDMSLMVSHTQRRHLHRHGTYDDLALVGG